VTTAAPGAPCDGYEIDCGPTLTCSSITNTCIPFGGPGAPCTNLDDCAYPLACTKGVCTAGAALGKTCAIDPRTNQTNCAPNLGCDLTTHECATIDMAVPTGGLCDTQTHFCARGSCFNPGTGPTGTCPTILADGASCDSSNAFGASQCAAYSECSDGMCVHLDPSICR
jgi:hypothetical protein